MIATHAWLDRTMLNSIDKFRAALGLDALVVVSNLTASRPWGYALNAIHIEMFGPNPEPLPDNKMAAKYYTDGIQYIRGNFGKGFKGVGFGTMKDTARSVSEVGSIAKSCRRNTTGGLSGCSRIRMLPPLLLADPYNWLSKPHTNEFNRPCTFWRPKPLKTTRRMSAIPS